MSLNDSILTTFAIPDPQMGAEAQVKPRDWLLDLAMSGAFGCRVHNVCPHVIDALWPLGGDQ